MPAEHPARPATLVGGQAVGEREREAERRPPGPPSGTRTALTSTRQSSATAASPVTAFTLSAPSPAAPFRTPPARRTRVVFPSRLPVCRAREVKTVGAGPPSGVADSHPGGWAGAHGNRRSGA
ncbi:hypothetical protein AB0C28_40565 [Nonomuraea sp. NPDC048892]|uniref:hypothetical protein n=1 Tax=Nonomuraea sp. NPDC048892 TaxID=3154624 RepID=UPI0033C2E2EF